MANPLLGFVLDGLETNVAWYRTRASSVTSRLEASGVDLRVGYDRRVEPRELDPVPGFIEPLVRWLLPGPLEEAVLGARLRWSPERFGVGASYGRQDNRIFRYERIIELQSDSLVAPTLAPREALEAVAEIGLRPLASLTADLTFLSTRDLLHPDVVVPDPEVQDLLAQERRRLAGVDVGWETNRSVRTRVDYRPRIVSWLRHEVGFTTRYDADRNAGFVRRVEVEADTVAMLERNASGEREVRTVVAFDFEALAGDLAGPDAETRSGWLGALGALRPVTYTWSDGIFSRFNRDPVSPGSGYQLGWVALGGYRVLDGDTAATLVERVSRQVSWGVGGGRAGLDATYGESDVVTLDTRADRTVRTEIWPDVRARLDDLPMAGFLTTALQRVSLSGGLRRSRREITYGQAAQRRHLDERTIPLDVTFTWVGGLLTGYSAELESGRGEDPTGDTERDRTTHRLSVSSAFLPPFGLGRDVPRPVRLSLLASYLDERECRVPAGRSTCVAFVDQINRALSMRMDTQVSDLEVGLQASYVARQSFVGQQRGSTQFQLSVFGQFLFEAGDVGGDAFGR
jgi:hypothetical protein